MPRNDRVTEDAVSVRPGGGAAAAAGKPRIGVLDRDTGFIQVLVKRMDRLGWEHRVLASPIGTDSLKAMRLSALIVDLTVLGPPAWEWLTGLCQDVPECSVLVCTGPSTVGQRVRGLRLGADDWIGKPCHPEEVIARVETIVRRRRRMQEKSEAKPLMAAELEIRADRFQAFVGGRSLDLTRREFELIELLASAEGRVLEREQIYSRLWGYAMIRGDRSVDVFVRKLRSKLEKSSPNWRYIHTHFGIGYRFAPEPSEELIEGVDEELEAAPIPLEDAPSGRRTARNGSGAADQEQVAGPLEQDELPATTY